MSSESIQIQIAGRTYPLKIDAGQVELFKKVELELKAHMDHLRESYAVKDNQDILAMTLLEYANRLQEQESTASDKQSVVMLNELEVLMDELK